MKKSSPKYVSKSEALAKLQKYCAYQDRCHQEVRSKLLDLGIYGDDLEEIISELITEKFLNEERFARSFARGKFRIKRWGKVKIEQELKKKQVSVYCIKKGLSEIEEEDYQQALEEIIQKKWDSKPVKDVFQHKAKVAKYVIQRGFESYLVWEILKRKEFEL